jgi:hypothetical protein
MPWWCWIRRLYHLTLSVLTESKCIGHTAAGLPANGVEVKASAVNKRSSVFCRWAIFTTFLVTHKPWNCWITLAALLAYDGWLWETTDLVIKRAYSSTNVFICDARHLSLTWPRPHSVGLLASEVTKTKVVLVSQASTDTLTRSYSKCSSVDRLVHMVSEWHAVHWQAGLALTCPLMLSFITDLQATLLNHKPAE